MQTIVIIAGGTSSERAVSLKTGAAVEHALQQAGFRTNLIDPKDGLAQHQDSLRQADAIFPALHGKEGEDGVLQQQLEAWGITHYVGSGPESSALCFDKHAYKQHVAPLGVFMPAGELVDAAAFAHSPLSKKPFVLKPVDSGSSIGVLIVRDVAKIDRQAITAAFAQHPQMLLEELIEGVEITAGVLGDQALPLVEIIPPSNGDFDYENKYNGQTQELCPPQHVSSELQAAAQKWALMIHQACGCRDLSRTDMIVGADGQLYILETNTMPGMTEASLFPKAAKQAGLDMPALVSELVQQAMSR